LHVGFASSKVFNVGITHSQTVQIVIYIFSKELGLHAAAERAGGFTALAPAQDVDGSALLPAEEDVVGSV
jgi:hypothetical protein